MSAPPPLPVRPAVDARLAKVLAQRHWGLEVTAAEELPGERDRNFALRATDGARYVLKVANVREREAALRQQEAALRAVAARAPEVACPRVLATRDGAGLARVEIDGAMHFVRVVDWVEGTPLAKVHPHARELLRSVGEVVARVDAALAGVDVAAAAPGFGWELLRADAVIEARVGAILEPPRRELVLRAAADFAAALGAHATDLPEAAIHNDANDYNVLVGELPAGRLGARQRRAIGLLDFGDMVASRRVFGLAVAAAYALLGGDSQEEADPLPVATAVVEGYVSVTPLTSGELACLWAAIRARLAVSVCMAAAQRAAEPDNEYLSVSEAPAWRALARTARIAPHLALAHLRVAAGMAACAAHAEVVAFLQAQPEFAPILGERQARGGAAVLDWSVGSPHVTVPAKPTDVRKMDAHIESLLAQAPMVVGRYDEPRLVYASPGFAGERAEPRTVHLGVDLFAPAGSPVSAPLAGVVHSVQDNAAPLDYGPTVILQHATASGATFFTLYGHLARAGVATLQPGQQIARDEAFAALGTPEENGGWSPHVHFQVIADLLGMRGDYPGVARASERAVWTSLCPDPDLILRLGVASRFVWPDPAALLTARRAKLGFNLSTAYARPLHFVRGRGQYLYDVAGRAWLDAVNNVPHVGHAHPRVVATATRQKGLLETNTRYLHEEILRLADRLRATLPKHLSVCFFVCSGSEANELALRLTRTHTGRRDVVVLEHGYHGNTTTLVELSHYKFARAGGFAPPPWVHVAACPDAYRARLEADPTAGATFAESVRVRLTDARDGAAAFLHESLPGCGGQVVPPAGYLRAAYAHARAAGALCIADEVQTGLGRVGETFWAFALQGVEPDVVTIGKPFGNGHPVAAVVTTEAVARSFVTGMEYFNTFGGNPVSCAVANTVLDVIEDEGLAAHAARVGLDLRTRLDALRTQHTIVGDVRGAGLFLGVELVTDRETRAPATQQASYIAERMRDLHVLVSTDGPHDNVLKIKPPLCFDHTDARRLVEVLAAVLREDGARAG